MVDREDLIDKFDKELYNRHAEKEDMDSFLSKVNELDELMKGLRSTDKKEVLHYQEKADKTLKKWSTPVMEVGGIKTTVKANRTIISKETPESRQRGFMAMMEKDARERAERRKMNEHKAQELMKKGNDLFHCQQYNEALTVYNEALSCRKDSSILYLNRALTLIKLERYHDALEDCRWALQINKSSFKARIYQARIYSELQDFKEAKNVLNEASKENPEKEAIIEAYRHEIEVTEKLSGRR